MRSRTLLLGKVKRQVNPEGGYSTSTTLGGQRFDPMCTIFCRGHRIRDENRSYEALREYLEPSRSHHFARRPRPILHEAAEQVASAALRIAGPRLLFSATNDSDPGEGSGGKVGAVCSAAD